MSMSKQFTVDRDSKPRVKIDQWFLEFMGLDHSPGHDHAVYLYRLRGTIGHGHPYLQPGDFIYSSKILDLDLTEGICETLNTVYLLGEYAG